ncbi:MAG: ankyrin repeat domain-containing protein, partial [Candidatus Acidiferrales bacterium]
MNKKTRNHFCLLGIVALLWGCPNRLWAQRRPDAAAEGYIRQVEESLPPDSSLRRSLEAGHRGSGLHYPWMDTMQQGGVKMAMFEVHGTWRRALGFHPESVGRIIYRRAFDGPNSQITDPTQLKRIRVGGLEEELRKAAFDKSRKATWLGIDSPPREGERCFVNIYLFDHEWLADDLVSSNSPGIGRYDPEQFPLASAAAVGDRLTVASLLASHRFTKDDLNAALFRAVEYPSDNTDVISLLLGAGADVNAQRANGLTPLMEAVGTLNVSNMKRLVTSGADIGRQTKLGSTGYSIALE